MLASASTLADELSRCESLVDRINLVRKAVPDRIALSTSLSMEDQVILDAIARSGADVDVFTLDTGRLFPETLDVIAASESRYGIRVRIVVPDAASVAEVVARDGIYGFRSSVSARQSCCDVRKVQPLRRALAGAEAWLTGLRRGQSAGRGTFPFAEYDSGFGLLNINPIADWSLSDVQGYAKSRDVPINVLHARRFPSIGCQPCTRAIRPGEDIRAGRWWWENEDGKECGLHNRPKPAESGA